MILRDPRPISIHMEDTAVELPALKPLNYNENPCPYWHAPSPKQSIDIEQLFRVWFTKIMYALISLWFATIISIFLIKLLIQVIMMK